MVIHLGWARPGLNENRVVRRHFDFYRDFTHRSFRTPHITEPRRIYQKDRRWYMSQKGKLYVADEKKRQFIDTNYAHKGGDYHHFLYYDEPNDYYYRIYVVTKRRCLSIFMMKTIERIKFDDDEETVPFDVEQMRMDGLNLYYNHQGKIYEHQSGNHWVTSSTTLPRFKKMSVKLVLSKKLGEALGVNVREFHLIMIGESELGGVAGEIGNDPVIKSTIRRFGGITVYYRISSVQRSRNMQKWESVSTMEGAYAHIYNHMTTEPLHILPMSDTFQGMVYEQKTKEYYYFNRANITVNCRYIQYSKTKNFVDWEPYQLISLHPRFEFEPGYNMYSPAFFQYPDSPGRIFGILTKMTPTHIYYYLVESTDFHNYHLIGAIYERQHQQPKTLYEIEGFILPLNHSLRVDGNYCELLYTGATAYEEITAVRFRRDGFGAIESTGELAEYELLVEAESDRIRLNYECYGGGFIFLRVTGADGVSHAFNLEGDEIDREIATTEPGERVHLLMVFREARVFSIDQATYQTKTPIYRRISFYKYYLYNFFNNHYPFRADLNGWVVYKPPKLPEGTSIKRLVGLPRWRAMRLIQRIELDNGTQLSYPILDTTKERPTTMSVVSKLPDTCPFKNGRIAFPLDVRLEP